MHPGKILENASGLFAYEPHRIDIMADESHHPDFLALNPNGKIPAIYDPNGPSGTPLALFESGAMDGPPALGTSLLQETSAL